jgi:hypothetical protein
MTELEIHVSKGTPEQNFDLTALCTYVIKSFNRWSRSYDCCIYNHNIGSVEDTMFQKASNFFTENMKTLCCNVRYYSFGVVCTS